MSVDASGRTGPRTASRRVKIGTAAAAVALVAVAGLALRWWTHPTAFGDLGDSMTAAPRPVAGAALSTTVILPQVAGEPEVVTIDDAAAIFSENTANATATFSICHMGPQDVPMGAVHDPHQSCRDFVPLEPGTRFRHGVGSDSDYLFVTITPTEVGVARLDRVEVRYERGARHLFQRGTESIRAVRTIKAT